MTSRGTMFDISVRISSTSNVVTSELNWRASRTASLYNEYNMLDNTNFKVGAQAAEPMRHGGLCLNFCHQMLLEPNSRPYTLAKSL